ncbi:MAG: sigma-70 family RNA polymerase sigma factor [Nocardioides sp.]|nr:sigma-70 family RNA polymerase sigma factor [Nocardioides sp.]
MDQTPTVSALVVAARDGDSVSWDALVDRFLPLVHGVISRYRLSPADAADVNQTVWLRLVEHLADLREPAALAGWLMTTARRESLRLLKVRNRSLPVDPQAATLDVVDDEDVAEALLRDERAQVLRAALSEVPAERRELLTLLSTDPPTSYDEISRRLGIPVGSIGPTRARALSQLRGTRALRSWTDSMGSGGTGGHRNVTRC